MAKLSSPEALFLLGFAGLLALLPVAAASSSISDLLEAHGLPQGLLPKEVDSFSLDPATGLLEVRLGRPCYARFEGPVFFDRVVRANLTYGSLRGVVGVAQEELFLWLPVRGIFVADPDSGLILFDIGVAHKRLSLSLFEYPPECKPGSGGEEFLGAAEIGLHGIQGGHHEQR